MEDLARLSRSPASATADTTQEKPATLSKTESTPTSKRGPLISAQVPSRQPSVHAPPEILTIAAAATLQQKAAPEVWSPSAGTLIAFSDASLSFFISNNPDDPTSPRHQPTVQVSADPISPRRLKRRQLEERFHGYVLKREAKTTAGPDRYLTAVHKRKALLNARRLKVRQWLEHARQKVMLQRQKERLVALRLKTKSEFAMRAAYLKRQMVLQIQVQRCAAEVDRAQNLALLNRLKRCMDLKRSYSTTFAEVLKGIPEEDMREFFEHDPEGPVHRSPVRSPNRLTHSSESGERSPFAPTTHTAGSSDLDDVDDGLDEVVHASPLMRTQSVTFPIADEDHEELVPHLTDLNVVFGNQMPTITRKTLQELSLESILTSTQIRHDLLFDPNLEFRVNDDGERGILKKKRSDAFWIDIEADLDGSRHGRPVFKRIPVLVHEIKVIMNELMASDDYRKELDARIDIPLIAQQLEYGSLDPVALIEYIAATLKAHCAPARDSLVDTMVATCKQGKLATTLRQCFEILERMKLDVANDQMKRLRPYFLETAVEFEWDNFKTALKEKRVSLTNTVQWLHAFSPNADLNEEGSKADFFNEAYVDLVGRTNDPIAALEFFPETFRMDVHRIHGFHNDWQDITIMCTLLMLYRQFNGGKVEKDQAMDMKKHLWILLDDADTTMHHISLHIADTCGKNRNRPFSEQESSMVLNMIDKNLQPSAKLFEVFQKRIGGQLAEYMKRRAFKDRDTLSQQCILEVEEELMDLGEKMRAVVEHNKVVYAKIYNQILDARKPLIYATEKSHDEPEDVMRQEAE